MNLNYESYLTQELLRVKQETELLKDYNIVVETEQCFVKHHPAENTIYVVIKYLSSSIQTGAEIQPAQILILSESNSLDKCKILFDKFANDYNWKVVSVGTEYIKQQYTSPVVLSNFNEVSYGYRSVLYMSSTLYVMANVLDVKKVELTTYGEIKPLTFSIAYSMSTNTQQLSSVSIASSVKNASTFNLTMSIPMQDTTFVNKIVDIMNETDSPDYGNENFEFTITFKEAVGQASAVTIVKSMKLISATITTAPNQVPSLQLGFMR